jgi:Transport and Golgi organisation 2
MCTVSFIPKERGFYLAMNRDEKRSRATALPPAIVDLAERRAIFPRESNGGTWIAANDAGVCLALINWHRIERKPAGDIISRGEVTKALAGKSCSTDIADAIAALTLRKLRPFRLIAVVPSEQTVTEWRWNLECLAARAHPWKAQHWFSSGFDERKTEIERRGVCVASHDRQLPAGVAWLRRLHRSHAPEPGPFSICMHRADAGTVSYTEVAVSPKWLVMRYKNGAPCSTKSTITRALPLL